MIIKSEDFIGTSVCNEYKKYYYFDLKYIPEKGILTRFIKSIKKENIELVIRIYWNEELFRFYPDGKKKLVRKINDIEILDDPYSFDGKEQAVILKDVSDFLKESDPLWGIDVITQYE